MLDIFNFNFIFYKIVDFFESWIYPGYYLGNLFFKRYDLIKMPHIKPWEYSDTSVKMKFAIFELIKDFIENEKPEENNSWYFDDEGNMIGDLYGEGQYKNILFPELKGKFIMDLIKEIYNFYTKELPTLELDQSYLLNVLSNYVSNIDFEKCNEVNDMYKIIEQKQKYTMESPEIQNLNWDIILKYIDKKEDIFKNKIIFNAITKIGKKIEKETQYYLHLAIEVRHSLWT